VEMMIPTATKYFTVILTHRLQNSVYRHEYAADIILLSVLC